MSVLDRTLQVLKDKNDIIFVAVNSLHSSMQQRIFQEGKDSQNRPLGPYRSSWRLVREREGKQIGNKDLNFEGDLELSFAVGTSRNDSVIGFTTTLSKLIASGQTEQVGRLIFKPTKEEIDEANKIIINEIRKRIAK